MNIRKGVVSSVLSLTLLVPIVAGCTNSSDSGSGNSSTGPTTITFWGWIPFAPTMEKIVADFNKKHPDIKVDYQIMDWGAYWDKLNLDLNNGAGPDVFAMNFNYYNKFQANMEPMDKLAATAWGDNWKDQFKPDLLQMAYRNNELKMMPEVFGGQWYLFYNKTLMTELGATVPKTYDELVNFSKTASSKTIPVLFGGKEAATDAYLYFWLANSIQPNIVEDAVKGKAKFTDEAFVKAFADFKKLVADGVIPQGSFGLAPTPDADNLFKSRKGAAVLSGYWKAGPFLGGTDLAGSAIEKDELGVIPMPGPGGKNAIVGDIDHGWAINANSKKKEAAMTFIKELTTEEGAKTWVGDLMGTPVAKNVTVDYATKLKSEEAKATIGSIDKSVANLVGSRSTGVAEVDNKAGEVVQAVMLGSKSPEAALKELQQVVDSQPKQ